METNGRPGAVSLKPSRGGRVCPLQLLSARKGIQVVPRIFRPESKFSQGVFVLKEGDSNGSDNIRKFHNRIHFRRFAYRMKVD